MPIFHLSSVIGVLGSAIKKAGGKDLENEIQNLSRNHGNLETAGGMCSSLCALPNVTNVKYLYR